MVCRIFGVDTQSVQVQCVSGYEDRSLSLAPNFKLTMILRRGATEEVRIYL